MAPVVLNCAVAEEALGVKLESRLQLLTAIDQKYFVVKTICAWTLSVWAGEYFFQGFVLPDPYSV
jgi:hypothetical protein